jgi:hypothetical protein
MRGIDRMPLLYHGTTRTFAMAMAGTPAVGGIIDVARGHGEFGRGFYTQSLRGNAYRRGQALHGSKNSALLILDIVDVAYHGLSFQRLTRNGAQMLDVRLRNNNTQGAYTTNHDVIVGPLVSQSRIEQQKFQSANAQTVLNGAQTQRTVI